jgi:putative ABC transport system substrate-binding protein
MNRREIIAGLGSAAAWPVMARAQQAATPVIGYLGSGSAESWAFRSAFQQGLKEGGLVEDKNVAIEFRWANYDYTRLPGLATDLVRRQVSVIVTVGNNLTPRAAKAATSTIPIVFLIGADPVQVGLVASIGRPGANITGVTLLAADLIQKRIQFLHDIAPAAKVFGFLFNPDNPGPNSFNARSVVELAQDAVRTWGGSIEVAAEFETAVADLANRRIDALATASDVLFNSGREQLAALAARHSLPAVVPSIEGVRAGGLMSYASSFADGYQQTGRYTARILKGEKPADLPVLQPTKFELVINLKTAKALGLTISETLLATADEVIQ